MNNAYYIAANSMLCQEKMFDVISGNVSNINTNGYKKTSVSFSDLMYSLREKESEEGYAIGNGITVNEYRKDFSYGDLKVTGNMFDLAFEKDGFLSLSDGTEQVFTRGGTFQLSKYEDGFYLANSEGYFLLDEYGDKIQVSDEDGAFVIDINGNIAFKNSDRKAKLAINSFGNPENLEVLGNNLYKAGNGLKENTQDADIILRQGSIEQSNVNISVEMTDLIQAQRLYQMNSKVLQVMDEISGIANRLRK
ncbi:MAG: flagellar hook-basal body protein [Clostridia bacterium]|jgi:flagellar basal body rod protein FlgG